MIGDRANVLNGSKVWPNVQIRADERVKGIVAVPLERAFYFYTAPGKYTGLLATTIEGFIEALEKSPIESIEFHVKRRDYERWAREVLALDELADDIEDLRRMVVAGEGLRHDIVGVAKKWADAIENS